MTWKRSGSATCCRPSIAGTQAVGGAGRRQREAHRRPVAAERRAARSAEGAARQPGRAGAPACRRRSRAAEAQVTWRATTLATRGSSRPADGLVGQRQVRPGQFVNVGTQVIAVVPLPQHLGDRELQGNPDDQRAAGEPARVTVDAFPALRLTGHVDSWSPGTGSTFALLPPDNATGNFTKVVQRVPVKIVLDPRPGARHAGAAGHVGGGDHRHRQRWRMRRRPGPLDPEGRGTVRLRRPGREP